MVLLIMGLVHVCSCGARTNHQILTFFFDGVPDMKEENADNNVNQAALRAAGRTVRQEYTEHGPYAAKQCEGCHMRGTNKLVMPVEDLCLYCHKFSLDRRKVHGPLASGGCRSCHNPHTAPYRYLLASGSREFCVSCHDRAAVLKRAAHQGAGETECTVCHDAHMSENEYLLK